MRAEVVNRVVEGAFNVLKVGGSFAVVVVVGHHLIEDRIVAGLFDVISGGEDQPQRVIVEVATDGVVAAFGERLVLVVGGAIFKLSRGDVDNTLTGALGRLVHKADEILVGIAETHTAANAGFKEGGGAAHVKGDHTLVLVPDIHHAIQALITGINGVGG